MMIATANTRMRGGFNPIRAAGGTAPTGWSEHPSSAVVDANRADRPDHAADAPHGTSTGLPSCTIHERVHTSGTLPYVAGIAKI